MTSLVTVERIRTISLLLLCVQLSFILVFTVYDGFVILAYIFVILLVGFLFLPNLKNISIDKQ